MEPAITVVIPFLDEEGTLEELHEKLSEVLGAMGRPYELLFVDDGSKDRGPEVVRRLAAEDPAVGLIRFRRNFGKSAALDAGFKRARGSIVITMDADLQDDPGELPRLVAALEDGDLDLVSGWKQKRHDPLAKTAPSKLFNYVVRSLTGLKLNDFNCGLKAYRREALEGLDLYGELHRYIPVLVDGRGFAVGELAVTHHPRKWGQSKYGVERMAKGFFDLLTVILLTRYRRRPLHLFGWAGLAMFGLGFLCLAYLTILWFLGMGPIGTRPLLFLGLLLVTVGVQLFSAGLLGEMINSTRGVAQSYTIRTEIVPEGRAPEMAALSSEASSEETDPDESAGEKRARPAAGAS
jgi:glycosyltransferase involved in cell wall biosynthesis